MSEIEEVALVTSGTEHRTMRCLGEPPLGVRERVAEGKIHYSDLATLSVGVEGTAAQSVGCTRHDGRLTAVAVEATDPSADLGKFMQRPRTDVCTVPP